MPVQNAIDVVRALDEFAAEPMAACMSCHPSADCHSRCCYPARGVASVARKLFSHAETVAGGLLSYGRAAIEQYHGAAAYIDRLLRDLPVPFPTKYDLVINLKTAKAMGLTIPEGFLLRADELIE
jgi:hypothetical protein